MQGGRVGDVYSLRAAGICTAAIRGLEGITTTTIHLTFNFYDINAYQSTLMRLKALQTENSHSTIDY